MLGTSVSLLICMDDICNELSEDVTTQNGCASVGTLYREPLGEVVVRYDSGCIIEKGLS